MVWDSIQPNLQDVKRGHTKARLLTGTYMFHSTKYKFNSSEVGMTNRSNQVDFAKSTFYFEISL